MSSTRKRRWKKFTTLAGEWPGDWDSSSAAYYFLATAVSILVVNSSFFLLSGILFLIHSSSSWETWLYGSYIELLPNWSCRMGPFNFGQRAHAELFRIMLFSFIDRISLISAKDWKQLFRRTDFKYVGEGDINGGHYFRLEKAT